MYRLNIQPIGSCNDFLFIGKENYHNYQNTYRNFQPVSLKLTGLKPAQNASRCNWKLTDTVDNAVDYIGVEQLHQVEESVQQYPYHNHPLIQLVEVVFTREQGINRGKCLSYLFRRNPLLAVDHIGKADSCQSYHQSYQRHRLFTGLGE